MSVSVTKFSDCACKTLLTRLHHHCNLLHCTDVTTACLVPTEQLFILCRNQLYPIRYRVNKSEQMAAKKIYLRNHLRISNRQPFAYFIILRRVCRHRLRHSLMRVVVNRFLGRLINRQQKNLICIFLFIATRKFVTNVLITNKVGTCHI